MPDLATVLERAQTHPPNILGTLLAVQGAFGYVDPTWIPKVATSLGVTDADVFGVLSFYHDLRTTPPGRHIIRFCLGDSCVASGCEKTLEALSKKTHCGLDETSGDGKWTIEKVYCLGNCALSPSVMVDGEVFGRVMSANAGSILKGRE